MHKTYDDGTGQKGIGINTFAERMGLSVDYVTKLCRDGNIFGARKNPLTKKWWIYPPAKLLCTPRPKRNGILTPKGSTLLGAEQG